MTTSFILDRQNHQFLSNFAKNHSLSKSKAINYALNMYRRYILQKELRESFKNQTEEDVKDVMSDFSDYIKIVENDK